MTGFVDVLLRGFLLTVVCVAAGGVAWVTLVLRAEAGTKPDRATARALRAAARRAIRTHSARPVRRSAWNGRAAP
ncbi:MAG: hypothetical protein ACREM3_18715 [Candidatus Rokuibacteriota bacterium]